MDLFWKLFDKIPHKTVQEKPARAVEKAAVELQRRNMSYQMIPDSDDDDDRHTAPVRKVSFMLENNHQYSALST